MAEGADKTYDALAGEPISLDEPRPAACAVERREFLKAAALAGVSVAALRSLAWADAIDSRCIQEAKFYEKLPGRAVRCKLCPRECVVGDGGRGFCRVRENRGGSYFTLVHSRVVAAHIDPIEKKPFFHFLPGTMAMSVSTGGCNLNCKFCQNWEISQPRPEELDAQYVPPAMLVAAARREHCASVALTYSEPIVCAEYLLDAAEAAAREGVRSVMVSGGFAQQAPLREFCRRLSAIKIDLKSFSEKYYREVVRGELKPVLEAILTARKEARWLEIVYLVVPTLNDSEAEFRAAARWMKTELGNDVPVHFTRFYPKYLLKNLPPTPVPTLERAKAVAEAEGLQYVYIGNVPGHPGENTYCPKCRKLLIERAGFTIAQAHLKKGKCEGCGQAIPGVWT
jgi:pyruvate formate lyase activating enzyme